MTDPLANLPYGRLGPAIVRTVNDWIAGEESQPESDPYAVQDKYNRQRDSVRSRAAGTGFQGEFRPREVLDADEFEKWDVATLRGKVDQIDLKAVSDLVSAWNTIADRHQTSLDTFTQAMARATDDSVWRGAARDAAASAVRDYAAQGGQLTNAARLTGSKLAELQTGLEPTKQLVPHAPEHRSGVQNFRSWVAGRGWRNDDVAEYNAKTEALRVLRTVYAPVVMESDTNVPVIPRPASVVNPSDTGNDGTGIGTPNTGTPNTTSGNPSTTNSPSSNPSDTEATDKSATPSSTQPTDKSTDTTNPTATEPTSTTTDATTPTSTTPATSNPPTTTNSPGTPTSQSPGSPSHTGSPSVAGTGTPTGRPSPGRSISATPNNSSAAAAAARSATSAGRTGTSGMGGMSPGTRGGKSVDESGKGIPDYLITQEHGDELIGLDRLPGATPPVIGE